MSVQVNAFEIVQEMHELGATFIVIDDDRWTWSPQPEVMRDAIRKVWRGIEPRPSGRSMVAAIRRLQEAR